MGKKKGKKKRKRVAKRLVAVVGVLVVTAAGAVATGLGEKVISRALPEPAESTYEVAVETNPDVYQNSDTHFVFPNVQSPEELDDPPFSDSWSYGKVYTWAIEQGKQDISFTHVRIAITAKDLPVILEGVDVEIVEDLELPLEGVTVAGVSGSPGPANYQIMDIDLSEARLTGIKEDAYALDDLADVDPNGRFAYEISAGTTELFIAAAIANGRSCQWRMTLNLLVDGKSVKKRIDDQGEPFVTVASAAAPQPSFHWTNGAWES